MARWFINGTSALLLVLSLIAAGRSLAADKVRVGIGLKGIPWMELPMAAAGEKGFWKDQKLEAEVTPFVGGAPMYRAMAAGHMDVGLPQVGSFIEAVSAGLPLVIVADFQRDDVFEIWVTTDSRIKKPEDLRGAKIGMARGAAHVNGLAIVRGLGIEKEVRFVSVGGTAERVAAVKAGAVAAFVQSFSPVAELMVKGELRSVASAKAFLPKDWVGSVVVAHKDFIRKNPEITRRTVRAIVASAAFAQGNPSWTIEKLRTLLGFSPEAARLVYDALGFGKDGKINVRGLENVRNFYIEYGVVLREKVPPVEQLYTPEFTG